MIDLSCPVCRARLRLVTRHVPCSLTVEQWLYAWLFDVILDRDASRADKLKARAIMRKIPRSDLALDRLRCLITGRANR